jgi:peroxiredoxin
MAEGKLNVGDNAPDFTLKDHNGKEVTLSQFKGKKVVLGFHPLAWTSLCAKQMKELETNRGRFDKLNAVAFGLSVDSSPCKHAWAKDLGIADTRLLSDFWPHGKVAGDYGVFRDADGFSERSVIIIGQDGKVRYKKINPIKELPDMEEIISHLENM